MKTIEAILPASSSVLVFQKAVALAKSRRYEVLLISFLVLIFGNTFVQGSRLIALFDIYQNLLICLLIFYSKKALRVVLLSILFLSVALDVLEVCQVVADVKKWLGILYLISFVLVAKEVYKEVLYTKAISREMLAAVLCGFVLLCLAATFLFFIIEMNEPHSFSNVGAKNQVLINLNYFSFTTLLTIGFGDIAPLTIVAKRAVMLMGLTGHFYTVFVTSIIIGKYLSARQV